MNQVAVFGVSALVSALAVKGLLSVLLRYGILDVPNERSSHKRVTPRGGGIGLLGGLAAGLGVAAAMGLPLPGAAILLGTALVAATGFLDDVLGGVPASIRLGVQVVAALIVIVPLGGVGSLPLPEPLGISIPVLDIPLALFWIVGVTNVYNFLDGIDGYAGSQGLVAGLGIAILGTGSLLTAAGLALAGACGGFLLYNWHPARIFMGDVGSASIGFFIAALPLQLPSTGRSDAVFFTAILLWFFLSDGLFTLVRRLLRGEKIWQAHRSHLYQRLTRTGMPHSSVVLSVGTAAVLLAGLAVAVERAQSPVLGWILLLLSISLFAVYLVWTRSREKAAQAGRKSDSDERVELKEVLR